MIIAYNQILVLEIKPALNENRFFSIILDI